MEVQLILIAVKDVKMLFSGSMILPKTPKAVKPVTTAKSVFFKSLYNRQFSDICSQILIKKKIKV